MLLYLGISYFEINVGNEYFYEIVIGVLGYFALYKVVFFSWIYLILFIGISKFKKIETKIDFSILNFALSVIYMLIFLINGKDIKPILNPFIATILTSFIILIYSLYKNKFLPSSSSV